MSAISDYNAISISKLKHKAVSHHPGNQIFGPGCYFKVFHFKGLCFNAKH